MIVRALLVVFVVLFGLLFVAAGVLCLWTLGSFLRARWMAWAEARQSRTWVATTGRITRALVTHTTGRRGGVYRPTIHYAYRVADTDFVSERFAFVEPTGQESDAREVVSRLHEGSDVTVYYDRERPERAALDRRVPSVLGFTIAWSLLLLFLGGVFTAIGVDVVAGAFEGPPLDASELPSTSAQLGGLVAGLGGLAVLVAGLSKRGRTTRALALLGLGLAVAGTILMAL